jgi:hypothetical protein
MKTDEPYMNISKDMERKKSYSCPTVKVIQLQQQSALLINGSQQATAPRYDGFDDMEED